MDLTMMLFLHDFSLPFDDPGEEVAPSAEAGPNTPRPADPSPAGEEGEPVGDEGTDEDQEPAESTDGLDG